MKALGKAKLVDASVPVEKIFREVFQSLSPVVLLVEVKSLVALMVSVVEIHVVLVLRVGKSPNSESQMTENTPGVVIAAKKLSLHKFYFKLLTYM